MNKDKLVKLIRLIVYVLATLFFFIGALVQIIETPNLIAYIYLICASFYLIGITIDCYTFVCEIMNN